MPEVDSFRQTLIIRQTVLNCNHKFKQNTIMMQISRQTNRARDKILTPWWLKFDYVLPKKLRPEYQKMSKEDPYLDGNCLRIHTKSAFIEFQKSPGLTFTQVRQHHKGGKFRCKRTDKCHRGYLLEALAWKTCIYTLLGYLKSLPSSTTVLPLHRDLQFRIWLLWFGSCGPGW